LNNSGSGYIQWKLRMMTAKLLGMSNDSSTNQRPLAVGGGSQRYKDTKSIMEGLTRLRNLETRLRDVLDGLRRAKAVSSYRKPFKHSRFSLEDRTCRLVITQMPPSLVHYQVIVFLKEGLQKGSVEGR